MITEIYFFFRLSARRNLVEKLLDSLVWLVRRDEVAIIKTVIIIVYTIVLHSIIVILLEKMVRNDRQNHCRYYVLLI